jgi:cytochrome d ubiquinol oxidase subunit II
MLDLETVWFLLIGVLLAGYAILDGFDLGVGILHVFVARDDRERRTLLRAIGPVWDGNEVWLLTAGGALFAAFPPVYATVFSGMYLALMLLLAALIARAVALEFRDQETGRRWRAFWDGAFAVGSFLPALLCGVALGNVLRGLPLDADNEFAGTFLGLLNPFALAFGAMSVAMFAMQGAAWLLLKTEGALQERVRRTALRAWVVFIGLWAIVAVLSWVSAPHLWRVYDQPAAWLAPAVAAASAFAFRPAVQQGRSLRAFAQSSLTITTLLGIVGQGLYPYLVPAYGALPAGLTIRNAASSALTLRTMLAVALVGVPIVLAYTAFIYHTFRGPVVLEDEGY